MKLASRLLQLTIVLLALGLAVPASATTNIMWWHAMTGELRKQLEKLAADFNASQSEFKVVPAYKGNYTETVTAAIFAFRSHTQPAIVQVNEIATATMIAARGAIYPVSELMQDQGEPFAPTAYLPAVSGYYADAAGNMLSFPFNASTPILYYNKTLFRGAGLDPVRGTERVRRLPARGASRREEGCALGHRAAPPEDDREVRFLAPG